jgi:hypothetical protein
VFIGLAMLPAKPKPPTASLRPNRRPAYRFPARFLPTRLPPALPREVRPMWRALLGRLPLGALPLLNCRIASSGYGYFTLIGGVSDVCHTNPYPASCDRSRARPV